MAEMPHLVASAGTGVPSVGHWPGRVGCERGGDRPKHHQVSTRNNAQMQRSYQRQKQSSNNKSAARLRKHQDTQQALMGLMDQPGEQWFHWDGKLMFDLHHRKIIPGYQIRRSWHQRAVVSGKTTCHTKLFSFMHWSEQICNQTTRKPLVYKPLRRWKQVIF